MIRLFLTTILCSLKSYTVTDLGTDAYAHLAHCTFSCDYSVKLENTYRYDDTIFTERQLAYFDTTISVFTDIYYTDINTYRIVVKTIGFQANNFYWYDKTTSEWLTSNSVTGQTTITINNGVGYSWTNNSYPDHIGFFFATNNGVTDFSIKPRAVFRFPDDSISNTGITYDNNVLATSQWHSTYPSETYLYTFSEYNSSRVYYELDYSMFTDTLLLLVGADSNFNDGYSIGYNVGAQEGYDLGKSEGYEEGYREGKQEGRTEGYIEGLHDGEQTDEQINSIYTGILSIGFLPINFFLAIFNFEILGINLSAFVSSILSVCVVIIVIKRVFSTEGGD